MNANAAMADVFPIGFSRDSEEFRTNTHRIAQFARSLDDRNPRHLAGEFAPPVFSHIPVMQSMVEVLGMATPDFVLHGEHDFLFHAPIVPGQRLFTVSTLYGVRGSRAGTAIIIRSDTATHDGKPVCTQYSTCLRRGEPSTLALGERPPQRPAPAKQDTATSSYALTPDQTRRYADAARDYSPYTIDPVAAAREGFPAPIVHGMCTLAFAARAIVDLHCDGLTPRLRRLGCRFAHPLFLTNGQTLAVEHWAGANGLVGFEATDVAGNVVIRNGYAEVSA
ncbi:acyl dehydratase [Mesorhizobium soli]|uniref:MaoC/PaaZ C-terminal domain-containing protein n=1 Tax=Pseudaminobacter soli (ex Li et al. 2025) TaxID=1295366 RepID=UPI002473EAFA|nr:MaoC/PaaZ C-terminal domain-containing protein [Mesorhizobium soli]MDH6235016.1 acyl dehydratase [Mesorhizobium soli]